MLALSCEKCEKRYKVDPRLAGKTLKCKVCGHSLVVPAPEPLESDNPMDGLNLAPRADSPAPPPPSPPPLPSAAKGRSAPRRPAPPPGPAADPTCPQCAATLTPGAKLCVACGYSLTTGKKLTTTLSRDPAPRAPMRGFTNSGNASRAGKRLMASDQTVLPERCVCCNSENGVTMKNKTFSYIPPWAIFVTGYLIGYFLFRRTSTLTYGMCAKHNQARTIMSLVAAAALLGAIGLLYYSSSIIDADDRQTYIIAGLVGIPVAIAAALFIPGPRAAHIDGGGTAQYRGCGKAFLDSL